VVPVWTRLDEKGPNSFIDAQMKAAMRDPFLLEFWAFLSTGHQDSFSSRRLSKRARQHKQNAIRLVNNRLNSGILDDTTIFAVVTIAVTSAIIAPDSVSTLFHLCFGTFINVYFHLKVPRSPEHLREVETHMNGVETMVNLRGGVDNLGMDGALKGYVCW
jgi:hypothetical protein